jgi:hypothetical protein
MGNVLALIVLGLPAAYVVKTAVPLITSPERWPRNGRWIVWGRMSRHPRPSNREISFWATIWTGIAVVWLVVIGAILFTAP